MAVQGISARDFFDLARFAWVTYENVKLSRQNFANLNVDVECLLISVSTLDQGHTGRLVAEYIDSDPSLEAYIDDNFSGSATTTTRSSMSQRQVEVRALRDGLHSVILPFYAFLEKHMNTFSQTVSGDRGSGGSRKPRSPDSRDSTQRQPRSGMRTSETDPIIWNESISYSQRSEDRRGWTMLPVWVRRLYASFDLKDMSEIRSRFAVQAANLNLFLTRLTHAQLQKQTEMLTLRIAEDNLLSGNWEYSRDLKQGETKFRQDVAVYVSHLLKGGMPFTEQELRRKALEDNFAKQRREDRKWAAQKIAEENKRKEQEEADAAYRRQYGTDPPRPARVRPESQLPDQLNSTEGPLPMGKEELKTKEEKEWRHTMYDSGFASKQKASINRYVVTGSLLEANLNPDAIRCLDEARRRLDEVEDPGLPDGGDVMQPGKDTSTVPVTKRRSDTLTVNRDDPKRHSFPGITVSPPPQYSEPVLGEDRKFSSSASPKDRSGSPNAVNASSSPSIPQSQPMQPSLSASPRVRPAQPIRNATTPAAPTNPTRDRPVTPVRRSPVRVRLCDQCDASIRLNEYFWRCSTGKCAGDGSSFDLCRKCLDKGYRCRGVDRGTCGRMVCTIVKDTEA